MGSTGASAGASAGASDGPREEWPARRVVLGGVLAGGLLAGSAAPASAASWSPRLLAVAELKPGDLVVGPDSRVVRVASRKRLASGRHRLRYTHPHTGLPTAVTPAIDAEGYAASLRLVVLLRGVPVSAVQLSPVPPPTDPNVIDGGAP